MSDETWHAFSFGLFAVSAKNKVAQAARLFHIMKLPRKDHAKAVNTNGSFKRVIIGRTTDELRQRTDDRRLL